MKKRLIAFIMCLMLAFGGFAAAGCENTPSASLDPIDATVELWSAPEAFGRNQNYKVEISGDGETWTETAVYNVKNGHQLGDKLINLGGGVYFGEPYTASLVTFDFEGTVGIRVTYSKDLAENGYVISPASYAVKSVQEGNTVTFTLTQDAKSPRKVVFRPDGEWEAECLQIMTNVPEKEYKVDETAENVYVIEEGDEIPLTLPEGKTVYYFKKGIHTLPGGYWAELDLGKTETVTSFDLMTPSVNQSTLPGGLCFELLAKQEDGAWESVYRSVGEDAENNVNLTGVKVNAEARYFRIVLHGNFNWQPVGNYRFIHKAYMSELRLFNESGENVALGRAVAGAGKDFAVITDGAEGDVYGHAYAGETFSVMDGYTYYLEKGSVLNGAFLGNGRENVTISGRGILDSSILESDHDLSEGRNGAIHFESLKNVVVEGITMMHAPMWMCVINYSENVLVDGVNLFGYCTNADGIHFSASKNAVATGCFIRTTDDLFVAYHYGDADGLTFRNSVLWSDGGRALLLGLASTGDIKNVTMENCDVITFQNVWNLEEAGGCAQIIATGGRTISNVVIRDVRIDEVRFPVIAQFLQIRSGNDASGAGFVSGVRLENVSYASECKPKSLISVMSPGGAVSGITFKRVTVGGTEVTADNIGDFFSKDPEIEIIYE